MAPPVSASNFYITRVDGSEETLYSVVFFGVQEGKLLFARPGTIQVDELENLPPVASQTVRTAASWDPEGRESVEMTGYGFEWRKHVDDTPAVAPIFRHSAPLAEQDRLSRRRATR